MQAITPQIFHYKGFISNSYFLLEPDGISMIDCGTRLDFAGIFRQLSKFGFPARPLKRILITHSDGDHYGAAAIILGKTRAEIWASQIEKDAIEKGSSSRNLKGSRLIQFLLQATKPIFTTTPTHVERTLQDKEMLPILGGLQVLETPGHTPGHLSYWLEKERILFAGDSIVVVGDNPQPSGSINTWDEKVARASFELQMQLNPLVLCAGHSCLQIREKGK